MSKLLYKLAVQLGIKRSQQKQHGISIGGCASYLTRGQCGTNFEANSGGAQRYNPYD